MLSFSQRPPLTSLSLLMLTQKRHHRHSRAHMGAGPSFTLTCLSFALILFLTHAAESRETPPPTPNLVAPPPPDSPSSPPFRPGIAVLVCVMTTIFSLTSLLLLYFKHCNGGNTDGGGGNSTTWTAAPFPGRKNSGIDRSVVESLPVFRFGALRGQKDGLDCAVCLTKFEAAEVLRLLPKCKHAFHVECVDTWLDAHSTCPLCRNRVDPEDILLVEDAKPFRQTQRNNNGQECLDLEKQEIVESRRRHSSVGESETEEQGRRWTTSFRRSLDSATSKKKSEGAVGVGCFVRPRKDGMLLTQDAERERDRTSVERRLEHRIIVSPGPGPGPGTQYGLQQRWSDAQASDLLYLTSEMIMSEAQWNTRRGGRRGTRRTNDDEMVQSGRGIINSRSVSEITGLSRFSSDREWEQQQQRQGHGEREEGLVRRWLGWISKSRTQPAVR
ncbi:RING-H2 finger protein ATL43 [Spatholobus suberectus]|nr:RING-H2 finger protein ATL43 [Spatholobus suberectus]